MPEQPAIGLRYEAGRYLVIADFGDWDSAQQFFRELVAEQEPRPFLGEPLPGDEVTPFTAALDPCPEDCREHLIHVHGAGGALYPVEPVKPPDVPFDAGTISATTGTSPPGAVATGRKDGEPS